MGEVEGGRVDVLCGTDTNGGIISEIKLARGRACGFISTCGNISNKDKEVIDV